MDSNWVLASSTATARTVDGNNLNRQSFNIPNLEKYSHIVIRLYYQHGLILFVNGIRYYVDNVSLFVIGIDVLSLVCSLKRIIL